MRADLISFLALLVGCGVPGPTVTTTEPAWPELCPGEPRAHAFGHESEDPECWRAHFPVRPCEAPVHPEMVGLWGLDGRTFEGRLLYDGCCVTFHDTSRRMFPTLDMAAELVTYGRAANVGAANRAQAVWDGDTLRSDSHLGLIEVGRRIVQDGAARLVFVDRVHGERRERGLVRFQHQHCIDEPTRDILCARLIVPGAQRASTDVGVCSE